MYNSIMDDEHRTPPSKRLRKFVAGAGMELEDLREKVKKQGEKILRLEEEKKKLEGDKKNLEAEKKELKEQNKNVEKELRGLIECPVCLMAPRERGPVPVCSNGHIVCRPCRDRIRQEAGEELAKCPSCMVDLGNAFSLIASRLVEKVRHECENDGCEELFNLQQLESHKKICLFRKVLCPGNRYSCKLEMPFNKVKEHVEDCPDTVNKIHNNNFKDVRYNSSQRALRDRDLNWPTFIIAAHDNTFYLRHKKEKGNHMFETIMLGSEEECSSYLASITIWKPGNGQGKKIFAKLASQPRPIGLQSWVDVELSLSGKALSKILVPVAEKMAFEFNFSIEKSE